MALFSSNISSHQSSHLVEFGAGKMSVRGKMVHPDLRKGTVFLFQSDDGLMHFCWKDAKTGTVEDDLIVFPDDAEFKSVKQCTTGRVYMLSFKNPSRKLFFWMQAFKSDQDEENCKKVNEFLNNPPVPGTGGRPRAGASGQENLNDQFSMVNQLLNMSGGGVSGEDMNSALSGMDRRQVMQLLSLMGGGSGASLPESFGSSQGRSANQSAAAASNQRAASAAATRTTTSSAPSGNLLNAPAAGSGGNSMPSGSAPKPPGTQQQPIINAADFSKILSSLGVTATGSADRFDETPIVADHQEISKTLLSPQFRQAVGTFGEALKSGQLGPFMQQFGFSSDVIKAFDEGDVQSVAEMLEKETSEKEETTSASETLSGQKSPKTEGGKNKKKDTSGKDKKDEDPMDLD